MGLNPTAIILCHWLNNTKYAGCWELVQTLGWGNAQATEGRTRSRWYSAAMLWWWAQDTGGAWRKCASRGLGLGEGLGVGGSWTKKDLLQKVVVDQLWRMRRTCLCNQCWAGGCPTFMEQHLWWCSDQQQGGPGVRQWKTSSQWLPVAGNWNGETCYIFCSLFCSLLLDYRMSLVMFSVSMNRHCSGCFTCVASFNHHNNLMP